MDVAVAFQRQEIERLQKNLARLFHRLLFGNPQRRFRNAYGEVVDFDAVKLVDRHLDGG